MKFFWCLLVGLFLSACGNEIDLNADWKDIPIVYGLLSASDTAQYIRVEKAFLDPQKAAGEIALIPDSIYYKNLKVSLLNMNTNETIMLQEVDGKNEGLVREDGAFATEPNTLYKLSSKEYKIKPGQKYELQIDRGESKDLVFAETTVIDTVIISLPGVRINFDYTSTFRVQWFPKITINAPSIYDVSMAIRYDEVNVLDPQFPIEHKTIIWPVGKNIDDTELLKLGKEFYLFLGNNLEPKNGINRIFVGIDVLVDAGGEEILNYVRVGQANLGITASQEIPFYTNLSEGRGIFSSRNQKVKKGVLLSSIAMDSLVNGQFTKQLNFRP